MISVFLNTLHYLEIVFIQFDTNEFIDKEFPDKSSLWHKISLFWTKLHVKIIEYSRKLLLFDWEWIKTVTFTNLYMTMVIDELIDMSNWQGYSN